MYICMYMYMYVCMYVCADKNKGGSMCIDDVSLYESCLSLYESCLSSMCIDERADC